MKEVDVKKPISRVVVLAVCLILMSVTTFLVEAQRLPPNRRFVDNQDGTITDNRTGLIWEKKTGTVGIGIVCSDLGTCPDPSDVNNRYVWSDSGSAPDGPVFTDFLAKMNCTISTNGTCVSPYPDWRIPTVAELETILTPNCLVPPCIHPIFGPTQRDYWSSTTSANPNSDPPPENNAWDMDFFNGTVGDDWKSQAQGNHVRAVRRGP